MSIENPKVLPYDVDLGTFKMPDTTAAEIEHKMAHIQTDLKHGYPHAVKDKLRSLLESLANKYEAALATELVAAEADAKSTKELTNIVDLAVVKGLKKKIRGAPAFVKGLKSVVQADTKKEAKAEGPDEEEPEEKPKSKEKAPKADKPSKPGG